jgi:outer membrane lipoprotein-sorting protein
MSKLFLLALLSPVILSAGCATASYSDERLKSDTAELLGVQADQVVISDKRSSGPATYYTAKTKSAEYSCTMAGGSVMKFVMDMGISSLPTCRKKDERPNNQSTRP